MNTPPPLNIVPNVEKYTIVVYGDDENQTTSKVLWHLLPQSRVTIKQPQSIEELESSALDAALIFIIIEDENDPNRHLGSLLIQNKRVVCSAIALTRDADFQKRIEIMASGFDAIFNASYLETSEIKTVFHNLVEKGVIRQTNKNKQEEYERFAASLSASPDAFIVFDENRELFFISDHYRRAYPDVSSRLTRGLDVMEAFEMLYNAHGSAKNIENFEEMKKFWEELDGEREFKLNDGRVWRIKAAKLAQGLGTIITTTDITHYIKQQNKLERQSQELKESLFKEKEASEIQKQFINMVSHEFRTPLTIIDGNTQLLINRLDQFSRKDVIDKLGIVRSAVSRLVTMLEGVLSSNMLKTGKFSLNPVDLNVKQMVEDISREHTDLAREHNISVKTQTAPENVQLDRKTVALVMSNLLSNAIKFSDGHADISVICQDEGDFVSITVQDNGIGIPENEINKIFMRYYRGATASGIPGSGIGLDLVKSLVDLHEGRLEVASQLGEGTEIKVFLKKLGQEN